MSLLSVLGFMILPTSQKRDRITSNNLLQGLNIIGILYLTSILVLGF